MQGDKKEVSFLVFVGFVILFLFFLFLGPNENTSNAIIGSVDLGDSPSPVTIIILFVILVVILAGVFFVFRKLKKKKIKVSAPGGVKDGKKNLSSKEDKKDSDAGLEEGDMDKLFSEEGDKPKEVSKEIPKQKPVKKIAQPKKKEVLTNLQDLKNKIKGMLTQKLTKEQIVGGLKSQGVSVDQITRAIEEVNLDSIRVYVTQALKQGFTKDQIIRNLANHGWKKEQISKVI
tara:strand:+ start:34 stop:726 length:693 start_codon:yes stop_codon:yes gene_type:complete